MPPQRKNLISTNNFSHLIQSFSSFLLYLNYPDEPLFHVFNAIIFLCLSLVVYLSSIIIHPCSYNKKYMCIEFSTALYKRREKRNLYCCIYESYKTIQLPIFATENIFSKHCWYIYRSVF